MVANIWPMKPAGVQLISPIRPPGRTTRTSSSAACWWCGANMMPTHEMAASNSPSAYGRCSASATSQRSATPAAAAAWRPVSISSGVRSLATTSAPAWAAGIDALPEPAAMSRTCSPGPMPVASTSVGPSAAITSVATAG